MAALSTRESARWCSRTMQLFVCCVSGSQRSGWPQTCSLSPHLTYDLSAVFDPHGAVPISRQGRLLAPKPVPAVDFITTAGAASIADVWKLVVAPRKQSIIQALGKARRISRAFNRTYAGISRWPESQLFSAAPHRIGVRALCRSNQPSLSASRSSASEPTYRAAVSSSSDSARPDI